MQKRLGAVFLAAYLAFSALVMPVGAEEVEQVRISAVLQEDGSAVITEEWTIDATQGTEWYLIKDYMGDMQITDLTVTDETGAQFETEPGWDVDRSLDQKAGKCGIAETSTGYEVCWGLGSYGRHVYTVQYTMTNFVKAYTDYDAFNIRFINDQMSNAPRAASVTIESPLGEFEAASTAVWAFGFAGSIYVEEGRVVAATESPMTASNHVTVMVRFEKGLFAPVSIVDESFSVLEDQALAGSDYTPENDDGWEEYPGGSSGGVTVRPGVVDPFIFPIYIGFIALVFAIIGLSRAGAKSGGKKMRGWESIPKKAEDYSREIPFEGSLPAAFSALKNGKQMENQSALIGAYLLRWTHRGLVRLDEVEKKKILGMGGGKQPAIIVQAITPTELTGVESQLYSMMVQASGSDCVLRDKEFYNWSQKNYSKVDAWFEAAQAEGQAEMRRRDEIEIIKEPYFFGLFHRDVPALTERGQEKVKAMMGFKKYLTEFTIINERRPVEVELWDDYLVFAALFGIAEQVAKEFKELYPKHFEQPTAGYGGNRDIFWTMVLINNMSRSAVRGAQVGHNAAASSRSGGGGGFSSFGGGGGFSGGGSGGGSR